MSESTRTTRMLQKIRQRWPQAWVKKFNDHSTAGIPDCYLAHRGRAFWVECKVLPSETTDIVTLLSPLQHLELDALQRAGQRVLLVGFRPNGVERVYSGTYRELLHPRSLAAYLVGDSAWR